MFNEITTANLNLSFSFKNAKEYVEFRKDWRERYKKLTAMIRALKKARTSDSDETRRYAQSQCVIMRRNARTEMENLELAKELARSQSAAWRIEQAVTA